jgi:hypothetical protein
MNSIHKLWKWLKTAEGVVSCCLILSDVYGVLKLGSFVVYS